MKGILHLLSALFSIITWPIRAVANRLVGLHDSTHESPWDLGPAWGVVAALVFCAIVVTVAVRRSKGTK